MNNYCFFVIPNSYRIKLNHEKKILQQFYYECSCRSQIAKKIFHIGKASLAKCRPDPTLTLLQA